MNYGLAISSAKSDDYLSQENDLAFLMNEAKSAHSEPTVNHDEMSDFFELTNSGNFSCSDVMGWWKSLSQRFPHISK